MHKVSRHSVGLSGVFAVDNRVDGLSKKAGKSASFYTRWFRPVAGLWQTYRSLHRFSFKFHTGLATGFGGLENKLNLLSVHLCTVSTDTMLSTALFYKKKGY